MIDNNKKLWIRLQDPLYRICDYDPFENFHSNSQVPPSSSPTILPRKIFLCNLFCYCQFILFPQSKLRALKICQLTGTSKNTKQASKCWLCENDSTSQEQRCNIRFKPNNNQWLIFLIICFPKIYIQWYLFRFSNILGKVVDPPLLETDISNFLNSLSVSVSVLLFHEIISAKKNND